MDNHYRLSGYLHQIFTIIQRLDLETYRREIYCRSKYALCVFTF